MSVGICMWCVCTYVCIHMRVACMYMHVHLHACPCVSLAAPAAGGSGGGAGKASDHDGAECSHRGTWTPQCTPQRVYTPLAPPYRSQGQPYAFPPKINSQGGPADR